MQFVAMLRAKIK